MPDADANPGLLLIISGPSGVGKTTITHHVEHQLGGVFSVSMTTRPQTEDDTEGEDYYFVDHSTFQQHVAEGNLLEWAEVFGDCYGTPRRPVEQCLARGELVILEIDVQGASQVKGNLPDAVALFVLPPDEQTLFDRLRQRRREDEAVIEKRFARAKAEIEHARQSGIYDHFITNDNLDRAVNEAVQLVSNERERRRAADERR